MLSLQPRQLLSLITFNKSSDVSFHKGMGKNILDDYLVGKNRNKKVSPFQIFLTQVKLVSEVKLS